MKSILRILVMFTGLLILSACEHTTKRVNFVEEEFERLKAQDAAIQSLAKQQSGESPSSQSQSKRREKRFSVSVNGMDAKVFFLSLVADSGVNVVVDPELQGSISLDLKNITMSEVLDVCREVYGYEYTVNNGIYIIHPRTMRTKIFELNYIDIARLGATKTSVVIGAVDQSSQDNSSNSNNTSNRSSNNNSNDNGSSEAVSGAVINTRNETDFWRDLKATVLAIVGGQGDGRSVVVNPIAGLVIVRALPKELNAVRDYLKLSEGSVKRQVVLETKILEVKLSDGYQSGINWNVIEGQIDFVNEISSQKISPGTGTITTTTGVLSSVLSVSDISDFVSLLETQGDVRVLSSPRVSTVNNQKAIIRVGSDEFFVTGIKNQTTSSAAATTTAPEVELGSFFSGISLDVTPQISDNGEVILHVHPIVSNVIDQQKEFTLGDQEFSIPLALRDIRESDSIVKAQNGQVVVLGGLMQERRAHSDGRRPVLGRIPVLNTLFKTKNNSALKHELVILMRPIVVNNQEDMNAHRDELFRFDLLDAQEAAGR